MPGAGIQNRRITRFHYELRGSGLVVDVQRAFPCFTAIRGFIHTAFFGGAKQVPHYRHPHDIGVARMHHDTDDMPAFFETGIFPAVASVVAAPHTSQTFGHIAPQRILPLSYVNNIFITGGHCHGTHAAAEILIADILPVAAAIRGFPDATTSGAEIKRVFIFIVPGYRSAAAAAKRPYQSVFCIGQ